MVSASYWMKSAQVRSVLFLEGTLLSCIDDIDWLGASLRKNQNPRCQRSSRLERTAEVRTRKNEDVMRVIRLG